MSTHNIDFYGEISKIISKLSSNTHLIFSSGFSILQGIQSSTSLCVRVGALIPTGASSSL